MKTRHLLPALAALILPASAELTADDYYRQGMAAKQRGDATAASNAFHQALQLRPDHPYARFELGRLKDSRNDLVATKRSRQLAAVRIPEVNFSEVALSDALLALGTMVEQKSAGEKGAEPFTPNFVIKDPSGTLGEKEITLQIKNVPAKVVLEYMLEQVGAVAKYEEYAISIAPVGRPAPPAGGPGE